ncbi:hypothetical protein [Pantanalinema sp. GBBB05]|uniref:hypothetical protein n=1 Tax=Pantanalinema sp. GBBB05 TaxID=2604139 RepID=UPI001D48BFD1|nr:hypothetical protein [Pantanalinema sp. GBBB05]
MGTLKARDASDRNYRLKATMGNSAQLSVVSRPETLVNSLSMTSLPPFDFATVRQTVLKLGQEIVLTQNIRVPTGTTPAITAMRQLVEVIQQLRSPEGGWQQDQLPTPAVLAPYVSEEAYEVLDVLPGKATTSKALYPKSATRKSKKLESLPSAALIVMDSLIPYLLWCVARTSYSLMQMMEGVPVRLRQGRSWTSGILRLVVQLDLKATDLDWCFDLATGCPPGMLLSGNPVIQSDINLPLQGSHSQPTQRRSRQKFGWVERQIQELTEHLQQASPMIAPLLAGGTVDLLPPGQEWRSGHLHLSLGLEFTPQDLAASWQWSTAACDLIEGELLEAIASQTALANTTKVHQVPVAVVDFPEQSLATTSVRLANPKHLDRYTNLATQAQLAAAIARLQTALKPEPEQRLLQVVQEAYGLAETARTSISLLQPDLLMDQLLPKLLWQLTAGSYEVMQLIGGVEARLLQPGCHWQDGSLRLMAVLHLTSPEIAWHVDLATGRLVAGRDFKVAATAIGQSQRLPSCHHPIQVSDLMIQLHQQIRETAPEVGFLMTKTAIEWLTTEQEWRSGFLHLEFYLEFLPKIFNSFADSPLHSVLLNP